MKGRFTTIEAGLRDDKLDNYDRNDGPKTHRGNSKKANVADLVKN
jgi:hypothetical protein